MPDKNPNTERWGGPGSSNEDATKPAPAHADTRKPGTPTNDRESHISGGGGERDSHHGHNASSKSTSHPH